MHTHRIGAKAHKAGSVWVLIAGLGFTIAGNSAWGQASAAGTDAPSESLRRQALSPYRFILQHANTPPRAKPAPAPQEPKRPAPAAVEQAAVQPRPASPAPTAAPQPAPEPVAAHVPKPVAPPPVVRREIIPVRTDEPRLPMALVRERPSGVVKVSFEVLPDGTTGGVKVVASTNRALNKASVEAVSGWKFQPVDETLTVETELAYKYD